MAVSRVLSIEITDAVTRVCDMAYGKKNPQVYKSIIFNNPEFTVDDGFIGDRVRYVAEMKNQLSAAGIKCHDVVFSLTSNKIVSREAIVPDLKPELVQDLIESERENYFPMDTTGYSLSYTLIERLKAEKQLRIMVYAVQDILVKNYTALANELDMKIVALDYAGNTTYQWLKKNTHTPMPMYLQINEKNSLFTILEDGKFSLQRNMSFGSSVLASNLLDEGFFTDATDDNGAMVKLCEQELLYRSYSEGQNYVPYTEEQNNMHQLRMRLTDATRPLIANISRVLEYYNTKNRDANVSTIYIGGIGARIKNLKQLIESEFNGIEIVIVDKLPGVNMHKNNHVGLERSSEFIACLGASEFTVNFFKKTEKEKMGRTLVFSIITLVVAIVGAVFIFAMGIISYNDARAKKTTLETQIAGLEASGAEEEEAAYNQALLELAEVIAMDQSTHTFNEDWNEILKMLEQDGVSKMTVTSLTSSDVNLTMNVIVESKEQAAKLIMQLKGITYFTSVHVNGIVENVDEETGVKTVSFSVICNYTENTNGLEEIELPEDMSELLGE